MIQLSEKELEKAMSQLRTKLDKKRAAANTLLIEIEETLKEMLHINELINQKKNANQAPDS